MYAHIHCDSSETILADFRALPTVIVEKIFRNHLFFLRGNFVLNPQAVVKFIPIILKLNKGSS